MFICMCLVHPSKLQSWNCTMQEKSKMQVFEPRLRSRGQHQVKLLYSWRFSRYSAPIHWLDHDHMTSNNKTVSRQMPWAGNIAKTMTSNGKQFTVTREMMTAVARDRRNFSALFKFCFCFVSLYNNSLNDWSLGEQWILFPLNPNVPLGTSH